VRRECIGTVEPRTSDTCFWSYWAYHPSRPEHFHDGAMGGWLFEITGRGLHLATREAAESVLKDK